MRFHQELHLFLRFLTKHRATSPQVLEAIIPLLDNEDFLAARLVYWFLVDQELEEKHQEKVNAFYQKYQDRL